MSDDDYVIQPGDLGGADEPENDPGVVEEAIASGETKQPISPCFAKIPFKNRKTYRKIYDSFTVKDMSFEDFCIEMYFMASPTMMRRDLGRVIDQKQQGNRRMAANLHNINKNLN